MTAVSLINPYAPQPATGANLDGNTVSGQAAVPVSTTSNSADAGLASDQSGQGAGNGTGTGGAHLTGLLKRARDDMQVQYPSPKSVVEAQSESDPATVFLAQKAERVAQATASDAARAEEQARAAKEEMEQAAKPEYKMPNPLPTAPILMDEDGE
ncbi:hypothetical protein [Roseobacter sp. OBYS 0001]|uniref:hypothetical protein n=1 Tax=Roseobacter sp. OBYS 0001 TaxID=882651 RepID=UPI001BBE697B|nr:hypothetical protein [Roseobacter sp. OBYS 0001]GIT89322.1 hypothetical protein ROBYS_43380 [Roseobacter sp. OBYS 0001]